MIVRKREALADEAGNEGPSGAGESETTARAPVEYQDGQGERLPSPLGRSPSRAQPAGGIEAEHIRWVIRTLFFYRFSYASAVASEASSSISRTTPGSSTGMRSQSPEMSPRAPMSPRSARSRGRSPAGR